MVPYPKALRTRVVAAVAQGDMTIGEVAEVCSVERTGVKKRLRLQRAGEAVAPRQGGGSAPPLTDTERVGLGEVGAQPPDVTRAECQAVLAAQGGGRVSVPPLGRALQQLQLPRKKKSRREGARGKSAPAVPQTHGGARGEQVRLD
jgi:transposase